MLFKSVKSIIMTCTFLNRENISTLGGPNITNARNKLHSQIYGNAVIDYMRKSHEKNIL